MMSVVINDPQIHISLFEEKVLNHLKEIFTDQDEIYFKPFINGDTPDFLIIQKNAGVTLINISHIRLNDFYIQNPNTLIYKTTNKLRMSPIKKLTIYKNNLFDIHIDGLLQKKVQTQGFYKVIKNIVIFENESAADINNFFKSNVVEYTNLYGKDSFTQLQPLYPYPQFTDSLHDAFTRTLGHGEHLKSHGKPLNYTKKQKELFVSKDGEQKIKGVAGAGKTYVLAKRAVNAHKRLKSDVLILTYNKSLKQYIRYRLNEIEEDFNWNSFPVNHYHGFMRTVATNHMRLDADFDDENVFEDQKNEIKKYKAIFIDEVQDYKTSWLRILKKYFLEEGGEFVVFGDEKQNIYDRELDKNKKINTTIPGRWAELKEGFRFNGKIVDLANSFQKKFMSEKYEIEEIQKQQTFAFEKEEIDYTYFDENSTVRELAYTINQTIKKQNIDISEVSILASNISILQELDYILRTELNRKTETVFETKEYLNKYGNNKIKIDEIRHYKKSNFNIYADAVKLSTTHSFKGFESKSIFMILGKEDTHSEIIYTAFTRCSNSLYIINVDNPIYDPFFKEYIGDTKTLQETLSDSFAEETDRLSVAQEEQNIALHNNEQALLESNKKAQEIQGDLEKIKNDTQLDQDKIEEYQRMLQEEEEKREAIEKSQGSKINALQNALQRLKNEKKVLESAGIDNQEYEKLKEFTSKIIAENIALEQKYELLAIRSVNDNGERVNNIKSNFLTLKGNSGKFKICIVGEITGTLSLFNTELQDVFEKQNISPNEWKIDHYNNKNIPNLNKFKKGQSGYHLVISGQIHHHSSKGNSSQNLLVELSKSDRYIPYRKGSDPKKVLSSNTFVDVTLMFLNGK